jgi:Glycosyltransferase 61
MSRILHAIEPERLYEFARERGLLADPAQAPPTDSVQQLPPIDVHDARGLVARLPEAQAKLTTSFRLRFPEAAIWGGNLLPVVFEDKVLPGGFSHQRGWVTDAANRTNTYGWVELPPLPVVDVPLERPLLLGFASHWGHFFTDTLDRLLALADNGELQRPLLVDALPPCANAMELMYLSGLLEEPIEVHRLKKAALYRTRDLEVQTLTSRKPSAPIPSFLRLRKAMFDASLSQVAQRDRALFVGRQAVKLRKISNQAELTRQIEAAGLAECIYPELTPIGEAARTFAAARTAILPLGSAKFNLMFCRPGTRVVCVTPRGYAEDNGAVCQLLRHMCAGLGLPLVFYACASTQGTGPRAHMLLHHDLHIKLEDVQRILKVASLAR